MLGVGGLHVPQIPDVPGAATFRGSTWHTSCWNHDIDLTGKHVTLVGVGASGVQVAPHHLQREKRGFGFHTRPELLRVAEPIVQRRIAEQIADPSPRTLVTPDYRQAGQGD